MAQSLAKVYLHVVFSTKNRDPLLAGEWRDELFRVLGGAANNLGCQSLIVGGVADHIHMLFQLGRTITIADAVGKIKSTSSAWINQTRGLLLEPRIIWVMNSTATAVRLADAVRSRGGRVECLRASTFRRSARPTTFRSWALRLPSTFR